jgi:hypothetical protein
MTALAVSLPIALTPRMLQRTFAVESRAVGVYWDRAATHEVTTIDWGELQPGSTEAVTVFLKNEDLNGLCFLFMMTDDWSPSTASSSIRLTWNHDNTAEVDPGETVPVILTLHVASSIRDITDFNFNIIILGTAALIGDANHDGTVNIYDTVVLAQAYGTTPTDPHWSPDADFNDDNIINIYDVNMLCRNYGASARYHV